MGEENIASETEIRAHSIVKVPWRRKGACGTFLLCNPNFCFRVRSSFAAAHGSKVPLELLSKLPVQAMAAVLFCRWGGRPKFWANHGL
ncbi:MAG: hypothetical protein ACLRWF_03435 [Ruthenibacterium sp.]